MTTNSQVLRLSLNNNTRVGYKRISKKIFLKEEKLKKLFFLNFYISSVINVLLNILKTRDLLEPSSK